MTQIFDLKQPVAAAMASGHTHGVCPKSGTIKQVFSISEKQKICSSANLGS